MKTKKQNIISITNRYYPQLAAKSKQKEPSLEKQESFISNKKLTKNISERKLQSKLKSIIRNIQNSLKEEQANKKIKRRENSLDAPFKQYGRQIFENRLRSGSHKDLKMGKIQKVHTEGGDKLNDTEIQQILRKKSRSRQSNRSTNTVILPRISSNRQRYSKLQKLDEKQFLLGKMVLDKVEKHFNQQKTGSQKYYDRVKSEQSIDSSLIEYLKHKVKKANTSMNPNQKQY